ncbi:1696_t:CDS:2, partial [Ambispora leptoticha]
FDALLDLQKRVTAKTQDKNALSTIKANLTVVARNRTKPSSQDTGLRTRCDYSSCPFAKPNPSSQEVGLGRTAKTRMSVRIGIIYLSLSL